MRKILVLLFVFSLGAAGGMWSQTLLLPYAATQPYLREWQLVKDWNSGMMIVRETEEVIISQDEGIERAIAKNQDVVVGIRSRKGNTILEGSGFLTASDGLIITLASLVPEGYEFTIYNEEPLEAKVLKRDAENDLALLSVEKNDFQTVSFVDSDAVHLGMPVFLIGKVFEEGDLVTIVNSGIVKASTKNAIRTNIFEASVLEGSPLFDIGGRVIGLNTIDRQGKVIAIPSSILREFSEL